MNSEEYKYSMAIFQCDIFPFKKHHASVNVTDEFNDNATITDRDNDLSSLDIDYYLYQNDSYSNPDPNAYAFDENSSSMGMKSTESSFEGNSRIKKTKKEKKDNPFIIITQRKKSKDAIMKKINSRFYKWVIKDLNMFHKEIQFNRLSKKIIKAISNSEIVAIMEKSLMEILMSDDGSGKYAKENRGKNRKLVQRINESGDGRYTELKERLNEKVSDCYLRFKKQPFMIKGPYAYTSLVHSFHENYLQVIQDNEDEVKERRMI